MELLCQFGTCYYKFQIYDEIYRSIHTFYIDMEMSIPCSSFASQSSMVLNEKCFHNKNAICGISKRNNRIYIIDENNNCLHAMELPQGDRSILIVYLYSIFSLYFLHFLHFLHFFLFYFIILIFILKIEKWC